MLRSWRLAFFVTTSEDIRGHAASFSFAIANLCQWPAGQSFCGCCRSRHQAGGRVKPSKSTSSLQHGPRPGWSPSHATHSEVASVGAAPVQPKNGAGGGGRLMTRLTVLPARCHIDTVPQARKQTRARERMILLQGSAALLPASACQELQWSSAPLQPLSAARHATAVGPPAHVTPSRSTINLAKRPQIVHFKVCRFTLCVASQC